MWKRTRYCDVIESCCNCTAYFGIVSVVWLLDCTMYSTVIAIYRESTWHKFGLACLGQRMETTWCGCGWGQWRWGWGGDGDKIKGLECGWAQNSSQCHTLVHSNSLAPHGVLYWFFTRGISFFIVIFSVLFEAKASVPGASNKLGDWVIDWLIEYMIFSM